MLVVTTACATLSAQREWFGKQPADAEVVKLRPPLLDSMLEPIAVPGDGLLRGLAARGRELIVARGDALIAFDVGPGKEKRRGKVPRGLVALAADEHQLYALCGGTVRVLDPETLELERELVLPDAATENGDATAFAVRGDLLLFVRDGRLAAIDVRSGAAATVPEVQFEHGASVQWLQGSSVTGELWGGDARTIRKMVVGTPQRPTTSHALPADVRRVCGAMVSGRLVLGVDGLDDEGRPRQLVGYLRGPWHLHTEMVALKLLRVGDDVVRYELGPKPLNDLRVLRLELQRIALEPAAQVPAPGGGRRLMPLTIEAEPGIRVSELLEAWDAASAVGFEVLLAAVVVGAGVDGKELVPPPPPPPEPPPPVRRDGK